MPHSIAELPRYLTRKEFADHLRVNPRTVDRMIREGEVRSVRIRRSVRIPREELDRDAGTKPNA
ncbi:excisionase family DNA-binding protein [Botrimarina mediterranea]|uniref:excisionase family DNA-binding protein n=1 Tax=Botrimarina mediterranea TaxID=2528022 RepID=UPI001187ADED|nr:Helix-turn-helix domain protein [Planctomycetes bacterium K2D]